MYKLTVNNIQSYSGKFSAHIFFIILRNCKLHVLYFVNMFLLDMWMPNFNLFPESDKLTFKNL